MIIYILGRQPAIGLAELESLYGEKTLRSIGSYAAQVDSKDEIDFARIGGAIKAAGLLAIIETTDLTEIKGYLEKNIGKYLQYVPEGKLKLGISAYGLKASPAKVTALGLSLKKEIRSHNRSVRLVPNVETSLNSAQVLHNKLTGNLGWELLLIKDGVNTIIARTTAVQNIDSYTLRDRGRPKRDARVGMLPPKLAQTIINLAAGQLANYRQAPYILDPFCGTGVIFQEALLMNYFVMGSDLDQRMVDYTLDNLQWLQEKFNAQGSILDITKADATKYTWISPFDTVASEVYLGRPFTSEPSYEILQRTISDCDTILRKFLKNMAKQTKTNTRMCLAVPTWFAGDETYHLRTLDHLSDLGYNRISFVHADNKDLIYRRVGQIVGRELLVLSRK